jgi:hypothetical protein
VVDQPAREVVGWIKEALWPHGLDTGIGAEVSVGALLPPTFDCYLRIFHRFVNDEGHSTTWSERADAAGVRYHSQLSERALRRVIGGPGPEALWNAWRGLLDDESRPSLCLALHEWNHGEPVSMYFGISVQVYNEPETVIEHPITEMVDPKLIDSLFDRMIIQSPQLVWPRDRSWIMCVDYDLTSTYVACDSLLATRLESISELEILRTNVDERVDYRKDTINCGPDGLRAGPPLG